MIHPNPNPALAACRQALREIRQVAEALDQDVAACQAAELRGERCLSVLDAATLLLRFTTAGDNLAAWAAQLAEAVAGLPEHRPDAGER